MEIGAGASLGRYQLLAEIGRGAMGTVYQAMDPEIDRIVAIKTFSLLDAVSTEGQAFRERFAQEARAAGRLTHPGIVAIYDRGEEPTTNTPYIVMEYVAGQPLNVLMAGSTVRLEERFALHVAKHVAEALSYAHERGVIHRDVKPANILITEDGNPKVADFGVARLDRSNLTLNGEVFGTPAYMAPEQITGGTVDGRSDIFSLGVILYTMLIGFRPFQGNTPHTIGFKVVNQEPVPITSFHLDLSKHTEYVVARSMAKNPASRYQTGNELALDLGDILEGREPRSRQDVTVRVSPEVFRISEGYRSFAALISAVKPKHISVFKDPPSTGKVAAAAAPAPVIPIAPVVAPAPVVAAPVAEGIATPPGPVAVEPIASPATPVAPATGLKLPDFRLPAFKLPAFKLAAFKLPTFKLPALRLPPIQMPKDWETATLAIMGIACLGAASGLLVVHAQGTALHRADAQLGMPAVLAEVLPAPPEVRAIAPEPVARKAVTKSVTQSKTVPPQPTKAKTASDANLDYTIIRGPRKVPPAPVTVAATSAPAPAPKASIPAAAAASLELALEHHFTDAEFSVWVDDKLAFSDSVHGEARKRLLVLHGMEGKETHDIHFPAGQHEIKVRVSSATANFDQTERVRSNFKETGKAVLSIHCSKRGLELKLNSGS